MARKIRGEGVPIYWTNSLLVPIRHRELVLKKVKGKSFKEDLPSYANKRQHKVC